MRSRTLSVLSLVIFGLACNAFVATPDVGDKAPNFSLPDTAGVNHKLTEFRGKVVVLNFWQSG
jgi:peroxiredoxin